MIDKRPLLMLIDGHALAFRAFHALREAGLRASNGEPTYAVYGFISILLGAIEEQQPDYIAVSFDIGRTFRDDLYAEYKAGRAETPEEFHPQLKRMQQLIGCFNIPIYTAEGYEADDVIGTLARQATAKDTNTLILTGDTDTLQLVDDHVRVLLANPYGRKTTTTVYDFDSVVERYKGLQPSQLADLRGLKGDTSDNIPGVKGIGEAGAISLLNEYGTVENLYEHLDDVPKRYQKHLATQKEQALFSKHIATIVCDVPVALDLEAATLHDYDRAEVIGLFHELEFGATLIKRLPASGGGIEAEPLPASVAASEAEAALPVPASSSTPGSAAQQLAMFDVPSAEAGRAARLIDTPQIEPGKPLGEYRAVQNEADLNDLLAELAAAQSFAFDTETNGLRSLQDEMVGISISTRPGTAWYIPVGHEQGEQLPRATILDAVRPFFADANLPKYAHNAKFDMEVLHHAGVPVNGVTFDTMLAASLLDKRKGLKDLAFYELKLPDAMTPIVDLIGKGKTQITFGQVPVEVATNYAAADADMTMRLVEPLRGHLAELPSVNEIFSRLEMPLLPVLARMEQNGITVDVAVLESINERIGARIGELEQEIYSYNEGSFNIGSGDQLAQMFFTKIGLDPTGVDKTKTGKYSLTAMSLEALRDRHHDDPNYAIIDLVLQHRQLTKLKSTYLDALPQMVNPETGRIHTSYSQLGAATGRLSSNDPNLQNIPVRSDEGREIRRAFVAAPGHVLVAADYSQIELRVLAHVTQDPNLVETFQEGRDIHAATASELFGVPMSEVSKNQRRVAKCVAAGTLVTTDRGILPIEQFGTAAEGEVSNIDCIVAQEGQRREQTTGFYNGGVQPTIRITTERGYVLEATANHRVRTLDTDGTYVWQKLGELQHGEYVALARGAMLFGTDRAFGIAHQRRNDVRYQVPERLTPDFARFLGYFVAEGNVLHAAASDSVIINNNDPDVLADLRCISQDVFGTLPKELVDRNGVTRMSWHSSRLADLLAFLGVGEGAANKRVPDVIMQGSQASAAAFLQTFFEGDGSISKSFISAASKSRVLIHQLQTLLLNFGIVTRIEPRDVRGYGRHYKLLLIGKESRILFAQHIGFASTRKQVRLQELVARNVTNEPIILPYQRERLEQMYPRTKRDLKETIHMCIRTKSPTVALTYRRLAAILDEYPETDDADAKILQEHRERNLFYDKIKSIEHTESQVYDLVVPETNTYIANGFVSHNTVVFGVIYGISSFGLAPRIESSRSEAQALIDALFARFPGIRNYIDDTLKRGKQDGYVQSLFGRRRYFPELRTGGPRRQAAEREAINAPIQATAADIMKIAMINLDEAIRSRKLKTRMLLQVHDEIILEAPQDELDEAVALVCEKMEGAFTMRVPLQVDVEAGPNWFELDDVAR